VRRKMRAMQHNHVVRQALTQKHSRGCSNKMRQRKAVRAVIGRRRAVVHAAGDTFIGMVMTGRSHCIMHSDIIVPDHRLRSHVHTAHTHAHTHPGDPLHGEHDGEQQDKQLAQQLHEEIKLLWQQDSDSDAMALKQLAQIDFSIKSLTNCKSGQ